MDSTFRAELREINEQIVLRLETRLDQRLAELRAELIKWMFLFWLGTVATMLGFRRFLLGG